jgi:hypothetical protein
VTAPNGDLDPERLAALVRVGHEVAIRARRLGADRLSVELATPSGPLWLSYECAAVSATCQGAEVELSALAHWQCWKPPGT